VHRFGRRGRAVLAAEPWPGNVQHGHRLPRSGAGWRGWWVDRSRCGSPVRHRCSMLQRGLALRDRALQRGRIRRHGVLRWPPRLGPAGERGLDPFQQPRSGQCGVTQADQVDERDAGEQPVREELLDPHRQQLGVRLRTQRGQPLQPAVAGAGVAVGQHRHHRCRLPDAAVDEVQEMGARYEVPGLDHDPVAGPFQLAGDPGRPALVSQRVADEEVHPAVAGRAWLLLHRAPPPAW
jgi:hypothetical protein